MNERAASPSAETTGSGAAPSEGSTADAPPESLISRLRERRRENDTVWLFYHIVKRTADALGIEPLSRLMWRRGAARELAKGLPGTNTVSANRRLWTLYDWPQGGEEWTPSPEWRQALIEEVMFSNVSADAVALEIGPGAGRWSEALRGAARELVLVDISESALELCRAKFAQHDNIALHVTDGTTIPVEQATIDFVWSFDVFVHIAPEDQRSYVRELRRVMRRGARAIIHHAGNGGLDRAAWRSGMTAERFASLVRAEGMSMVQQLDRWGPHGEFAVPNRGDVISIFER